MPRERFNNLTEREQLITDALVRGQSVRHEDHDEGSTESGFLTFDDSAEREVVESWDMVTWADVYANATTIEDRVNIIAQHLGLVE